MAFMSNKQVAKTVPSLGDSFTLGIEQIEIGQKLY